jgi:hypothetical protein
MMQDEFYRITKKGFFLSERILKKPNDEIRFVYVPTNCINE